MGTKQNATVPWQIDRIKMQTEAMAAEMEAKVSSDVWKDKLTRTGDWGM